MRVVPLSAKVRQLSWFGPFNCYLVEDAAGELTLVDTGMFPQCAAAIRAEAGTALRRIVLTHAHADHVNGVAALAAPGVEIAISARDARILSGDRRLEPGEPQDPLRGLFPQIAVTPTRLLNDGDTVGPLRVVAAPGHTPGHIALLCEDGVLLAGDAFVTVFGPRVCSEFNPLFPFTRAATWHEGMAIESARRLASLRPAVLAVGHGAAVIDPTDAMHWAIDRAAAAASPAAAAVQP